MNRTVTDKHKAAAGWGRDYVWGKKSQKTLNRGALKKKSFGPFSLDWRGGRGET